MSSDLFSTTVAPLLDDVRANILTPLGLRVHRVWIVTRTWDGAETHDGNLQTEVWEEIVPVLVKPIAAYVVANSGGQYQDGTLDLQQISRANYTEEDLAIRDASGNPLPKTTERRYAVMSRGETRAQLYNVASRPRLFPTEWRVRVNPMSERLTPP